MKEFISEQRDGVCLSLKVQPRASRNEIAGILGEELKIKVTAPPVDSAANEAVLEFLAETLKVSRSAVQLMRGGASRHKQVRVTGMSRDEVLRRLRLS